MEYPGFSIVHVQSPCTTYNDTYEALKGNPAKGIDPGAWDIPESHDPSSLAAALDLVRQDGIPVGMLHRATDSVPMHQRLVEAKQRLRVKERSVDQLLDMVAV